MLVAPVNVEDEAYTGAGSVITGDVPPGALGVARARQRNIDGYADRRKERDSARADEPTDREMAAPGHGHVSESSPPE